MAIKTVNNGRDSRSLLGNTEHPENLHTRVSTLERRAALKSGGVRAGGDPEFGFLNPPPIITSALPSAEYVNGELVLTLALTLAYDPPPDFVLLEAEIVATAGHPGFHRWVTREGPFSPNWTMTNVGLRVGATYSVRVRALLNTRGWTKPSDWVTNILFGTSELIPDAPTGLAIDADRFPPEGYRYDAGQVEIAVTWDDLTPVPDYYQVKAYRTLDGQLMFDDTIVTNNEPGHNSAILRNGDFQFNVAYFFKVRGVNGLIHTGPWSADFPFTPEPPILAPENLQLARTWGEPGETVAGELTWEWAGGMPLQRWDVEWQRTTERWQGIPAPAEARSAPIRGLLSGSTYRFRVRGIHTSGLPGEYAEIGPITVAVHPKPGPPPHFDGGAYDSTLAGWKDTATGGSPDWAIEDALSGPRGKRYITVDMAAGESGYVLSPAYSIKAGEARVHKVPVRQESGAANVTAAVEVVHYDGADAERGTGTVRAPATLTTVWEESEEKLTAPPNTEYFRYKYTGAAPLFGPTGAGKVAFGSPDWQVEVESIGIADGAISDAKLGTLTDPTNFEFNIETNPLLLYNSAGAYIGRVYYDPTGSGKVVFAAESAVDTPDVSLEGGGGVGFDITTAGYHLEEAGLSLLRTAIPISTTLSQDHMVVLASNTITLTLPDAAAAAHDRRVYIIKNVGTGTVTIDGDGSDTIDGVATYLLPDQNDSVMIQADGTNWRVLAAWHPDAGPGPLVRLSAEQNVTVDGSNNVEKWQGANAQSYMARFDAGVGSTSKPKKTAGVINDKAVVRFDGSNDALRIRANADLFDNWCISIVVQPTSSAGAVGIMQWAVNYTDGEPYLLLQRDGTNVKVFVGGAYQWTISHANNVAKIYTVGWDGWDYYLWVDGTAQTTVNNGATTWKDHGDYIYLGNGYNGYYTGDIAELVLFGYLPRSAELLALHRRMGTDYGITVP